MLKITKGALMVQSSKQMCIILGIVRILSPSNNSAANSSPGEKELVIEYVAGKNGHCMCVHFWNVIYVMYFCKAALKKSFYKCFFYICVFYLYTVRDCVLSVHVCL